jgi:hypothetical protein
LGINGVARADYSEDEDFYSQDFAKDGVVSVWVILERTEEDSEKDALQDQAGVGYYNLGDQEANTVYEVVPLERLLRDISYSETFATAVIERGREIGVCSAYWLLAQFDFAYSLHRVRRAVDPELVFIGVFEYVVGEA